MSVPVHPATDDVAVTTYSPDELTTGFCAEELNPPGPVQLKVTLSAVLVADNITLGMSQVISLSTDAVTSIASPVSVLRATTLSNT